MPDDKIKILYDKFSTEYKLGTYDEFAEKLQDEKKRKIFYDAISKEYKLGTYDEFANKVKKKDEPPLQPVSQDSGNGYGQSELSDITQIEQERFTPEDVERANQELLSRSAEQLAKDQSDVAGLLQPMDIPQQLDSLQPEPITRPDTPVATISPEKKHETSMGLAKEKEAEFIYNPEEVKSDKDRVSIGKQRLNKVNDALGSINRGFYGLPASALYGIDVLLYGAAKGTSDMPYEEWDRPFARVADQYTSFIESIAYVSPEKKDDAANSFFHSLGSLLGLAVVGSAEVTIKGAETATSLAKQAPNILKNLRHMATSAPGIMAGLSMGAGGFDLAKSQGATDEQALVKAITDTGIGFTYAIPISRSLNRLNQSIKGGLLPYFQNNLSGGVDFAIQSCRARSCAAWCAPWHQEWCS